jgi:hypothetical protein
MLLHEVRNDDGIRAFFNDVWECYVKTLLNPFYAVDKPIKSTIFETKVKAIAKVPSFSYSANSAIFITLIRDYLKLTRCLLFHSQKRWTFSWERSLSIVFNSNANVLLSNIRWMAVWHERHMDAPRVVISTRVNKCRFKRVRCVERGIRWWKVSGIYRSHNYISNGYCGGYLTRPVTGMTVCF